MKKRSIIVVLVLIVAFVMMGCTNKPNIYGNWIVKYTATQDNSTKPVEEQLTIAITIQKDGTVLLANEGFGTFTKDRNRYSFKSLDNPEIPQFTAEGEWDLSNDQLAIYIDGSNVYYILQRPQLGS